MVKDFVEFAFDRAVAGGDAFDHWLEVAKIVQLVIEQVRARDVGKGGHHCLTDEGRFLFEFVDEAFDAGAF